MNKSGSGCVSSISVIYFLFQISSKMDFLCCPGDHSSPWQPCTPPAVIAWVYYYKGKMHHDVQYTVKCIYWVCVPVYVYVLGGKREWETLHAHSHLPTNPMYVHYICTSSSLPKSFPEIHSTVPSIALYITLACFTAVLNRGQRSNEKELSWLKMPQLLLLAGLHWAFTKNGNLSTITAL